MKYPSIPDYLDGRRKVFHEDVKRMKVLWGKGFGHTGIAKLLGVTSWCVKYHLNPEHRRKSLERRNMRRKRFILEHPRLWKRKQEALKPYYKTLYRKRYRLDPAYKKYRNSPVRRKND